MAYRVVFLEETDQDIAEAVNWYRAMETGLEQRFKADLAQVFPILQDNPSVFQEVAAGVRIALTKRFRFRVVYEIRDGVVVIVAIMHPKRHQRSWKKRIQR